MQMPEIASLKNGQVVGEDLSALSPGNVSVPGSPSYDAAVSLWNGAVGKRPAAIVRCVSSEDVSAVLRYANTNRYAVSVKGGGHDWAGRSLVEDGIVIDLSGMKSIEIDPDARTAVVGGGVLSGELVDAAEPHDLVPIVGTARDVGLAGFTLGGGYGPLLNRYGLAADNLLGATIVLSDGNVVTADENNEPELLWGLRGGGGNFGVVTSMRLQLHYQPEILTCLMLFPWNDAEKFLEAFAEITAEEADDLTILVILMTADDGNAAPVMFATWAGEHKKGEQLFERFNSIGSPLFSETKPMSLKDFLAIFRVEDRKHQFMRNRWTKTLPQDLRKILLEATECRTTPGQYIVLHHFCGAAARILPDATAFGMRDSHYLVEAIASWAGGDSEENAHRNWVFGLAEKLAAHAMPGGYANLLGPEETELYRDAYGGNAERLRLVKQSYDPDNSFSSTLLIP